MLFHYGGSDFRASGDFGRVYTPGKPHLSHFHLIRSHVLFLRFFIVFLRFGKLWHRWKIKSKLSKPLLNFVLKELHFIEISRSCHFPKFFELKTYHPINKFKIFRHINSKVRPIAHFIIVHVFLFHFIILFSLLLCYRVVCSSGGHSFIRLFCTLCMWPSWMGVWKIKTSCEFLLNISLNISLTKNQFSNLWWAFHIYEEQRFKLNVHLKKPLIFSLL